jgi:hypothetical protein
MMIHLATLGGGAADPETLKAFKDSLRATHLTTNQSLQENAYKCVFDSLTPFFFRVSIPHPYRYPTDACLFPKRNYGAFVAISKEIATLENEMLELKAVLEEFKTLPSDLDMGLGTMSESNLCECNFLSKPDLRLVQGILSV